MFFLHKLTCTVLLSLPISMAVHAAHSVCANYRKNTEHYKTCVAYPSDKVKVLSGKPDLNDEVNKADEGTLLVIPATTERMPYTITAPLKLKNKMGLLSTGDKAKGFFYLTPADKFSIGDDGVYTLVSLASGSRVTGLAIHAQNFSKAAATQLRQLTVPRTLVYASDTYQFTLTFNSLIGRSELEASMLSENPISGPDPDDDTIYTVRRTWMETAGAKYGLRLTSGSSRENAGRIFLKHNMAKVSGTRAAQSQKGFYITYGKGEIEHNYFAMDDTNLTEEHRRYLLTLEDLYDPEESIEPSVAVNYFYSPKKNDATHDVALQFLQSEDSPAEAHVFASAYTSNMQISRDNTPDIGERILLEGNYVQKTAELIPDWEAFFNEENLRAGICLSSLYALSSLKATAQAIGGDDAREYLCGTGLKRKAFRLDKSYTGMKCKKCTGVDSLYQKLAFGLGGLSVLELVIIIPLACLCSKHRKGNMR